MESEDYYRPSSVIAGWAAARPFPNLVPTLYGPHALYNLPGGPTIPKQLMQQGTVPPTFDAGSYQTYLPQERLAPGVMAPLPGPDGDGGGGGGNGGGGGGGGGCCCKSPEEQASIFAMGIKKILPELATSVGVQTARANAQQVHARPGSIDPPVRAYDFESLAPAPITISDAAFVNIAGFRMPRGWNGVAKFLGFAAESAAALSDIQFRVLVDGVPVFGLENIRNPAATLVNPMPITVKAIEDQSITVQAIALTVGANHFVRVLLKGWTFQPSLMTNLDSIQGWRGQ